MSSIIILYFCEVRYHLDEDPKTLKVFPIPLLDASGTPLTYDRLSISPDGKILAVTHASTLQWLSVESGKILDTADKAHDGMFRLFHVSYKQIKFLCYGFLMIRIAMHWKSNFGSYVQKYSWYTVDFAL